MTTAQAAIEPLFPELVTPEPEPPFRFIDLFAGIGGIRMGLEHAGGKCVYTVEFDRFAMQTYGANFGELGPEGRRRRASARHLRGERHDLPPYDVLAAGFPCQPFSIAGVSQEAQPRAASTVSRTRRAATSSSRSSG